MYRRLPFLLIAALLLIAGRAAAVDYDAVMRDISGYQFGETRYKLIWVEELVSWTQAYPHERQALADSLAAQVGGNATDDAKDFAARQLVRIGTARHVPALAALLCCSDSADRARYALERIPDPEVDDALLEMLEDAERDVEIGIVNTLGMRAAASAVPALTQRMAVDDPILARAAIAALGRMTTRPALRALTRAKGAAHLHIEIMHARLAQADTLTQQGNPRTARRIFAEIAEAAEDGPIAFAARLGLYRLSDEDAREEILSALSADEQARIRAIANMRTD